MAVGVLEHKQFVPLVTENRLYRIIIVWTDYHQNSITRIYYHQDNQENLEDYIKKCLDYDEEWRMSIQGMNTTAFYEEEKILIKDNQPNWMRLSAFIYSNDYDVTPESIKEILKENDLWQSQMTIAKSEKGSSTTISIYDVKIGNGRYHISYI